jgi:DNA polymerase-3 subunit alpha (Gram-positive type)
MKNYCIIPENQQNFMAFVHDLEIDAAHKAALQSANVSRVYVDVNKRIWNIHITFTKPVPENIIKLAEQMLAKQCGLHKVSFIADRQSVEEYLKTQWTDFVGKIAGDNHTVRCLLASAQWDFNGKILMIETVGDLSAEMLTERGIPQTIATTVWNECGQRLEVSFRSSEADLPLTCDADLLTPEYLEALTESSVSESKEKDENPLIFGRNIKDIPQLISSVQEEGRNIVVAGELLNFEMRELKSGRFLLTFDVVDATDGLSGKAFFDTQEQSKKIGDALKEGMPIKVKGTVQYDKFANELVLFADSMYRTERQPERMDTSEIPRVELHAHTRMSNMDSVVSVKSLIKTAAKWKHPAVAITDHGVVQAFPEAQEIASKEGIKVIYGMEGYLFDADINKAYHIVILAKNSIGLRNLYRLVSISHLKYFHRTPRIPKKILAEHREGLVLGSACEAGELIQAIVNGASDTELVEIASFYDYLEIQPTGNNEFMLRKGLVANEEELRQINRKVCDLGKQLNKLVVATCDVHFMNASDSVYRQILMAGKGFADAEHQPPLYFRTTEEMLTEFSYLGAKKAYEVVVENTRKISELIEVFKPIPDELYSPKIPGAEEAIRDMSYEKARSLYGEDLPEIVSARLEYELKSIINNGFAVLYFIAHKLVKKSLDDGYLVGSRGSVGSSFVATMTSITEVNPLPPHWRCPVCKHNEFITDGTYGGGFDLPDKECPKCKSQYIKDGHDIPFAVFMGFHGDKVPDIDLNFSGTYQPVAHKYTEELFGKDNVFRAGTIATIAEKTAYGYVKNYFTERGLTVRNAHINKLIAGCTGVKRTTGQHPGGIMVVPRDMDVHHFTPIQHPADDKNSSTITTHFDYHSISSRLVKLDILGHDDPTVIRMLQDVTGLDPLNIPFDDAETMSLFSSTTALKLTPNQLGSTVGTFGIPEFGTKFVRQMLEDTKPKTFSELVRISGFSHGTDVWLNNAQDLIKNGTAKLSEAISARDDIMVYLIHKAVDPQLAFKIMESVRKGKGVKSEDVEKIRLKNVPEWYIDSCQKIKYMFPKAHAVAYVMMAVRIAWFKIHRPLAFYAAYFTVRATEFDAHLIVQGEAALRGKLNEFEQKGNTLTAKEKGLHTIVEIALEMNLRGFILHKVDLYQSDATKFLIVDNGLLPPLASLQGLGDTAAHNIVQARKGREFLSVEDLRNRSRISKTVIEILKEHGCLNQLPEDDQIMLFA